MFSTNAPVQTSQPPLRSSRRRQRNGSDDSVKLPKAKRQRSALRKDTFEPVGSPRSEDIAEAQHPDYAVNLSTLDTEAVNADLKELSIRGPKKSEKRPDRSDGTVILSSNDYYNVSQLPTLPDQIRLDTTAQYRTVISSEHGYALALTRSTALVWPYASSTSSPAPKDLFTFTLPFPLNRVSDPLPLGCFVSKPASSEPGLLVASSSSGQITYWETISNAEIMGLIRQKQNGIQGVVPGMFSGEIITDLACAEPAGFILSFSSGRVAQLAVRDSQGRPAISVRFLQGGNRSATGGILGGIRNVLSGSSWKKGIASVKASESHSRGQRDVTIVSLTGAIEVWDMHWSNGPSLKYRAEAGRATLDALRKERLIGDTQTEESLTVLDFATDFDAEHSTELALASYQQAIPLLLLVAAAGEKTTSYSLVEIAVTGREVSISSVLPINTYTSPVDPEPAHRPRLAVLKKGAMAFVTFARAICLVSLASVEPSPSSQLLQETSFIPTAFQDCIHFREDRTYRILGSELEEQAEAHKNGAYLAMVQNFGLIRITLPVTKQSDAKNNTSDPAYRLSAKSRLEQAIFFGSKRDNPLDFVSHEEMDFPENEITHAALAICNEILRSSSSFIPTASPSIEHQLALRAKALHDLAAHLKRHCPPLPRLVKWELLRAGEKLAAQRAIWKTEQEILKRRKTGESTIFNRILWYMHERFKTEVDWDRNENDQVRHWLIYDTWRTEYIVPWFLNVLRQLRIDGPRETATVFENLFQATTLFLAALETGFRFREDNATLYGLGDEPLEDCILLDGYDEQLEFWTSREVAYTEAQKLLDLDIQYCRQFAHSAMADKAKVDQTTVLKLTALLPRAFHVLSLMHTERYRWLLASSNPGAQAKAASERLAFGEKRSEYLFEFGELDLLEEGIELAEKARDMASLVDLVYKINKRDEEQGEQHKEADLVDGKKDRIALYFEKYGELWGDAFFGKQVNDCHLGTLLNSTDSKAHQSHLTRFLQKRPELSSIKWINDICGEHSYEAAAATLETVAFSREINIWNKKVELSLGRLAQLAAWEQSSCQAETPINPETPQYKKFYGQLNLIDIQQMLHEHIQPALHGAIDQKAELELAMDQFGQKVVAGKPMLRRQLEMAFSKLIMSKAMIPEEIVDILTLMDPVRFLEGEDDGDLLGREFFYSLRIVDYSGMRASDPARADAIEQLIWRRCMIRDDWTEINKTELKSDAEVEEVTQSTALFLTIRHCLEDGIWDGARLAMITPDDVLSAPSFPEALKFSVADGQLEGLAYDLEQEKSSLQKNVEKGRLSVWYPGLLEAAKAAVVEEADQQGEREASAAEDSADDDFEMGMD